MARGGDGAAVGAPDGRSPAWAGRWWAVGWRLAAYVVLLLLLMVTMLFAVVVFRLGEVGESTIWGVGSACVATLLTAWVMMSGVESRTPASLGIAATPRGARDFAWGFGFGFVLVAAIVGAMALAGWLSVSDRALSGIAASGSMLYVTVLLILAAFFEELAIRGYPFQLLARAGGPAVAIGATSLVFAGLHAANPGVGWAAIGNTLLAGILLGLLYWKTLSLWLVTGTHFAWNWTMGVAAGLPVSGLNVGPPVMGVTADGPALWTGGEYGPEGGLLLTLATLAGIAWTARTPRLSRDPAVLALGPLIGTTVEPGNPVRLDSDARRIESEEA